MSLHTIGELLGEHRFFKDLPKVQRDFVAGCGVNKVFKAGEVMAHEGDPADVFFVLRSGRVAVETHVPHRGAVILQTCGEGEVLGWSWLFPPHVWTFDVRALDTVHVITINGKCLRDKCETDLSLGYQLMRKFSEILSQRLRATRLQLLDLYAQPNPRGQRP